MATRAERGKQFTQPTRLALVERDLDQHDVELADHENRLRGLERIGWKVLGAALMGGVLSGVVSQVMFG